MVISHLKVLKPSTRGSLSISSPLAFAEGLFCFLNYFSEKEGFLRLRVEYNLKVPNIYFLFVIKRIKRDEEERILVLSGKR